MEAITVVIETPRHAIGKYVFDQKQKCYRLKKLLPLGMNFPYDFGMIPGTLGEDGDPIDAMVISECTTYPGIRMQCRLIGALLAEQSSAGKKPIRNDRFFLIPSESVCFEHITEIDNFSMKHNQQLEEFFVNYNKVQNKTFTPLQWIGAEEAGELLAKAMLNVE